VIRRTAALLLLSQMAMAAGASAEPVRLPLGADHFAQGWLFSDRHGVCRIITAGHNLRRGDGLVAPVAVDRQGREIPTSAPVQPDPNLDLAFLEARPARACPSTGLGEADVDARMARSPQAFLEIVSLRAAATIALVRRARAMDDEGGRIVVFDRANENTSLRQGISGGMIVDVGGRPLAIAIETDMQANRARAIRIDVAASLLHARITENRPHANSAATMGLTVQHGRSIDPLRGPDRITGRDGAGWSVEPARGIVVLLARFDAARLLGGLSLRVDEETRGQITGIVLEAPAGSDWVPFASCRLPPGATDLACRHNPKRTNAVRMTIRLNAPRATLSHLVFSE